jgi:ABC-2 type transport system permease protein
MNAILWREIKVVFGSIFGLTAQFLTPVFFLVFFATAFSSNLGLMAVGNTKVGYLEFFAPGLFGYVTFMILTLGFSFVRLDVHSGMLAIVALSRTSLAGYYWGKLTMQVLLAGFKILLLGLLTAMLVGHAPRLAAINLLLFAVTLVLSVAVWFSLGLLGGVFVRRDDLREIIMIFVTLPLTFASSMYYKVELAPTPIRWLASVNPLTYSCNLLRGCYLDVLPASWVQQLLFLVVFAVVLVVLSLWSLKRIRF